MLGFVLDGLLNLFHTPFLLPLRLPRNLKVVLKSSAFPFLAALSTRTRCSRDVAKGFAAGAPSPYWSLPKRGPVKIFRIRVYG